jgi:hypothetical protein
LPGYDIPARLEAIACYIDVLGHKLLVSTAIDCIAPHHATIHVNKPLLVVPAAKAETTSSEAAEKGPKVEG